MIGATLLLSGCTFKDIDKRAFVTSIGIDQSEKPDKKYKVMIKVAIPNGDPKIPKSEFLILTANTDSVSEALNIMKSQIDKELVYGHSSTIVIGEKLAKSNIQPLLEFFVRRPDIQMTSYLSVGKPNAFEVLNFKPIQEQVSGGVLKSYFDFSRTESPYIDQVCLFDAYRRETEDGIDIVMPIIESNKKDLLVDRIALFDKSKMIMELSPSESETYRLLTTGIYDESLKVKNKKVMFVMNLEKGKANYKLKHQNKNIVAYYTIKVRAVIEEKIDDLDTIKESDISELNKHMEDKINAETKALLNKIKEKDIDPIGFGLRYLSRHSENRNLSLWNKKYANLAFKIKSEVKIKGTGLIN
ncbi:Ger(x)C family spore germination protein [Gottfriedia sp. NPDC058432]|uniref:Ger(x)C family spore germination protein n=1 Tax=Gottfriedia sp. NPDC058432 TaxID=3346497 RepID=UPI00364C4129